MEMENETEQQVTYKGKDADIQWNMENNVVHAVEEYETTQSSTSTPEILQLGEGMEENAILRKLLLSHRGKHRTERQPLLPPPLSESEHVISNSNPPSPPSPFHKIQKLDEESLKLDQTIGEVHGYQYNHDCPTTATAGTGSSKHLIINQTIQNVINQTVEKCISRPRQRKLKVTDYFYPRRRSNRKTKKVISAEKHELLVKAIVKGGQEGLEVKQFNGKGRGVVATRMFQRHEFVVEYAGELLTTSAEARKREAIYAQNTATGCYMYYFQHNNKQYCVDATKESDRVGRLINHSRNGNLSTKLVHVEGTPRLIFLANRDIKEQDELCYDYGDRSRDAIRHHPWLQH